jgi:fructoselysine-6-P-deglycase FrlB-like protein
MTANEFNYRKPRRLGPNSLVVVTSFTGTTPETLVAVETARNAGVPTIIGLTNRADCPLGEAVDEVFACGTAKTAWDAREIFLAHLAHGLLEASGAEEDARAIAQAYDALPVAIPQAIAEMDDACHDIAEALQDEPIIYVLGSGPVEGTAYCFAMCYLQEMQWIHAAAFNAGEFLHGAFEVTTEQVPFIVFVGEDETRPMAERALAFLKRYTPKVHVIDSRDFSLPGVPDSMRAEIAPIALGAISTRLAQHFEAVREHDLSTRRYMFAVDY